MTHALREDLASLKIDRRRPPARRPRGDGGGRLLTSLLWLIPLAFLGGAGTFAYRQYEKIRPRPRVTVATVQRMTAGEAETLLTAKGYITSRNLAKIGSKVTGRIRTLNVEEGTKVQMGQVLAELEHDDTTALLEQRQAMVERARADLLEAEADLREKERRARRGQRLLSQHNVALEDLDKDLAARDMARAKIASLRAEIRLMEAQVRETKANLGNMTIVAPFAGTVITKDAEVGETLTPGGSGTSSGRGSLVTLADLDQLEVETDINENLLARVGSHQPAEIAVSAIPDRRYRGRLRRVIPMGDRTRGTIKVKVSILDPDERLFPELVATVHFLPDGARAASSSSAGASSLFVPRSAVVSEGGETFAWVLDDRKRVRRRRIEVVLSKDTLARVTKGLKEGETVVIEPPPTLRDQETVVLDE